MRIIKNEKNSGKTGFFLGGGGFTQNATIMTFDPTVKWKGNHYKAWLVFYEPEKRNF
jgi:hypothetical protein